MNPPLGAANPTRRATGPERPFILTEDPVTGLSLSQQDSRPTAAIKVRRCVDFERMHDPTSLMAGTWALTRIIEMHERLRRRRQRTWPSLPYDAACMGVGRHGCWCGRISNKLCTHTRRTSRLGRMASVTPRRPCQWRPLVVPWPQCVPWPPTLLGTHNMPSRLPVQAARAAVEGATMNAAIAAAGEGSTGALPRAWRPRRRRPRPSPACVCAEAQAQAEAEAEPGPPPPHQQQRHESGG